MAKITVGFIVRSTPQSAPSELISMGAVKAIAPEMSAQLLDINNKQ